MYVRTNIFVGYAQVGVGLTQQLKGITFIFGNDLTHDPLIMAFLCSPTHHKLQSIRGGKSGSPLQINWETLPFFTKVMRYQSAANP